MNPAFPMLAPFFLLLMAGDRSIPPGECTKFLDQLQEKDPVAEADSNFRAGDRRLRGVRGVGIFFPGLPDELVVKLVPQLGYRMIEPTSDAIADDSCAEFQSAAVDFAEAYNKVIVSRLRAS
jgi:hypothetical protein